MVLGGWNVEYFQAAAEVLYMCVYVYLHKHICSVMVLVLTSKLAHFKRILINQQFYSVNVHLCTYNACLGVYVQMCVKCSFFRINLRTASVDTSTIPAASTTSLWATNQVIDGRDTATCQAAGEKCLSLKSFSVFKSAGCSANAEDLLCELGLMLHWVVSTTLSDSWLNVLMFRTLMLQ